jgi:hypothetical protein
MFISYEYRRTLDVSQVLFKSLDGTHDTVPVTDLAKLGNKKK